ncbi:MAG: polysaccharide biosynthesis protein [Candidatus Omnitrophica bacterium]|nr:polysaccharide biosynthesis protein [Candidatus Omnitrophota bacterium]MDD5352657.1 polysaccharide biosynthesis protein [Candidatus Omnitrophota bacterium]MDD5550256.1 polysaccharide biosynthesis protein [Candidatus Omnitrophota bacterium]
MNQINPLMPTGNNSKGDSLRKRYFYKFFSNILGFPINLVMQSIITRGLGPQNYGDFNFLSNFFNEVIGFFNMGTSIGFYTKLSQRPKESKLVLFYFYFMGVVMLLVAAFVIVSHSTGLYTKLWPVQKLSVIYLALCLGIFTWLVNILSQMTDAYGVTVVAEISKMSQKILGLIIIAILFVYQKLNLINFFFYNYFMLFLLILLFLKIMKHSILPISQTCILKFKEIKEYTKEFYKYSHPLFLYGLVGMFVNIFDIWLLQFFGGSIQQGFFGLSYQISTICILFTSAMTPLILREFSIAHNNKDLNLISNIFRTHMPLLYSITAFIACFIAVNADRVVLIMGGGKFSGATLAVIIMAFYPLHQTYGQLSGSVFYATDQTRLYRNIGVVFMLFGLPVTYLLIAPKNLFGMSLGANGLAIKAVFLQFISVNVMFYFISKFLKLSFWKYCVHQILCVGCLLTLSIFANYIVNSLLGLHTNIIVGFLTTGFLYSLMVGCFILFFPPVFGIEKTKVSKILTYGFKMRHKLNR